MNNRCLHCKAVMPDHAAPSFQGDFCSEFCLSQYPGQLPLGSKVTWTRSSPTPDPQSIQEILDRNRGILRAFKNWQNQASSVSDVGGITWLQRQGFDFDHHTRLVAQPLGQTEIWCYDEGYRIQPDGRVEPL